MYLRLICACIQLFLIVIPVKATFAYPGLTIEHFYPEDFCFALWGGKPIEHVSVTGPEKFFAESSNSVIRLPSPPIIGNTYIFNIVFEDGSYELWGYTVTGFNNNFAHIISPANAEEEIITTTPTFIWSKTNGISSYALSINGERADGTYGNLWLISLPIGTISCAYNFDGTATENLQIGKRYGIVLSTTDSNGHVAVTMNDFFISGPCTEIETSRKYRMSFQYDTSIP